MGTFFKSTMCTLKAVRCWLKLKATNSMPKGWLNKRQKIYDRLEKLDSKATEEKIVKESEKDNIEVRKIQKRVNLVDKIKSSYEAITFNILRREKNKELQEWKSYPGIEKIVHLSRNIVEKNETSKIMELIKIMRVHENQQSAPIVATIALLVGNRIRENVSKEVRLLIGDIIRWDVRIIKRQDDWPVRKKFSTTMIPM